MNRKKSFIITGIILLAIAVLLIVGAVIANQFIERKLKNQQLETWKVQSKVVKLNLLLGNVRLEDITINNKTNNQSILIPKIRATGIKLFPLIFRKNLAFNTLTIENPTATFIKMAENDKIPNDHDNSTSGNINLIRLNEVEISDANIHIIKQTATEIDTILLTSANVNISDITLHGDQEPFMDTRFSFEGFRIILTESKYNLPGGLYKLEVGNVDFNSSSEGLSLQELRLSSLYPKHEIGKINGTETDWYNININKLQLTDIHVHSLYKDTAVIFRKAVIDNINAEIYRDKRLPFPDKPDTKLPMDMLADLPFKVHSDTILVIESSVVYEEHSEDSAETGTVSFNELYASIYNLSNYTQLLKGPTAMSARTHVMNNSLLEAEFIFPNQKFSYKYKVTGQLSPIEVSAFNPMLQPSAFIKVNEGRISNMEFQFEYDYEQSEGQLQLEYENLKVNILDKEDGSKKKLKSFLTNSFVLQQNNVKGNDSYKEGTIQFERDKKKSIINYWWKSLFSGIKDILAF